MIRVDKEYTMWRHDLDDTTSKDAYPPLWQLPFCMDGGRMWRKRHGDAMPDEQ